MDHYRSRRSTSASTRIGGQNDREKANLDSVGHPACWGWTHHCQPIRRHQLAKGDVRGRGDNDPHLVGGRFSMAGKKAIGGAESEGCGSMRPTPFSFVKNEKF